MESKTSQNRLVKLFRKNGRQAVLIPKELELPNDPVVVRRRGNALIIEPEVRPSLLALLARLKPLSDDFPPLG